MEAYSFPDTQRTHLLPNSRFLKENLRIIPEVYGKILSSVTRGDGGGDGWIQLRLIRRTVA